ncbi:Coenzyme Q (ubiquinone) biosynthesis protein Coq4 [Tsuneonella dongtanensis]|uniref:Coenzyme Q (Ubiquinone) biosynthesis protein Coq4 n=1 Tax=Tsuneonella dongtanensis TaxID=692370 RepID=A0A1B2AEM5_9SPHN|nr:Coq4 family protein [Tsuneonella dongtanensis]ANY20603.1 Coenzyme Q (ubiquinone) biosynthesis protein Coq4 [Tsuneonella dongtanensis]
MTAPQTFPHADPNLACAADGTVFRDPSRPQPRRNVRKALRKFGELIKDKENTALVFEIYEALPSKHFLPRARALTLSENGARLRTEEPALAPILDDHDALRKLPAGSVAHAYCDFMEREGLSAAGLVAESEKTGRPKYDDLVQWYGFRQRDTHDLMHVLTGYGRDALGEQCVLLFTHGQSPAPGHLLLGYAGAFNITKQVKSNAPVFKAVREAHRLGKACPPLVAMSIRELLAMDLADARQKLRITPAYWYKQCHEIWRSEGIDPYDLLGKAMPEKKLAA